MFKRKLEIQELLIIILSMLYLAQLITSALLKSEETIIISDDGLVAIVPSGETLIAKSFKSTISITPIEKDIEFKWYFLGWHNGGTYPISNAPTKIYGFTVEKFTTPSGEGIKVTKPNNIFYTFR